MGRKEDIASIIIAELKLDDVTPETFDGELNLVEDLGVDSMELTTVAIKLQEKYKIKIEEEDYQNLVSLNKIVDYVNKKVG